MRRLTGYCVDERPQIVILLLIPAVVLAVMSLASFAGHWIWWLDVLANFRAQYVVGLTVLGLTLVLFRWRRSGVGILVVALANLAFVAPLYLGAPGRSDPSAPTLRVLSFNLLSSNESYNDVIEYVEAVDPDLTFLYEASRPWEVALDSARLPYQLVRGRSEDLIFGTLALIRGGAQVVSYGFAETEPRALSFDYQPEGWPSPVAVLATHALAPTSAERAGLRDAQLEFAGEWAENQAGPVIVVGDFNATPWSWPFRHLLDVTGLHNSQVGFGLQPSFAATSSVLLRVPIDHLLHSDQLRVRDRRLGPDLGSDHFPLLVDLEYTEEP